MRDYKCYLPHHRDVSEPVLVDRGTRVLMVVLFVGLIGLLVHGFVDAIVRTAEIDAAVADARRKERERIYTANKDILAGHEAYVKQLDAMIDKAYRQGR